MLHAFAQQKARKVHARSLVEDEITAVVFGPVQFMAAKDAWHSLIGSGVIDPHRSDDPVAHHVEFWGLYSNPHAHSAGWKRCYPDFVARFSFEDGSSFVVIVEIKWDASGSSRDSAGVADQLARQWVAVAKSGDPSSISHVYLTKSALDAREEMKRTLMCDVYGFDAFAWYDRCRSLTWLEFSEHLGQRSFRGAPAYWAEAAVKFLRLLDIAPFEGFDPVRNLLRGDVQPFSLLSQKLHWPVGEDKRPWIHASPWKLMTTPDARCSLRRRRLRARGRKLKS